NETGYKYKIKKDKIYVENDFFTAAKLYFKQNGSNVEFYRIYSATSGAWVLIIVGCFVFLIVGIIIGIKCDTSSKNFAEENLFRMLGGHKSEDRICPSCGRTIPLDAYICPYCGRKFESYL
ncbi:unnamed protein product, partial [marine sediment metagenome]